VLNDNGIEGVADPSGLFLSRHPQPVSGTCVTVALEGRRPLVAELQGLVPPSAASSPRRTSSGLDAARLAMVVAVLTRRARLPLAASEIYAATVGGVQIKEPAADLAVALALASAFVDRPLPDDVVAFGEIGLAGEVRAVGGIERRLQEASRLGFRRAFTPHYEGVVPDGMSVLRVANINEALAMALSHR
jgi:DNA repair protein RadA/Sms